MPGLTDNIMLFARTEFNGVETFALLRVVTNRKMSPKEIVAALKKLVTRWVKETDDGKKAWEDSGHDFNVGDLYVHEVPFTDWAWMDSYPADLGIANIEFVECADVEAWPFDMILVEE